MIIQLGRADFLRPPLKQPGESNAAIDPRGPINGLSLAIGNARPPIIQHRFRGDLAEHVVIVDEAVLAEIAVLSAGAQPVVPRIAHAIHDDDKGLGSFEGAHSAPRVRQVVAQLDAARTGDEIVLREGRLGRGAGSDGEGEALLVRGDAVVVVVRHDEGDG